MRNISSLVAIAIVAMTTFASAEAAKRKPAAADTASNRSVNDNGRYNANAYDPAGNYAGYPDWARRALSPRAGGPSK